MIVISKTHYHRPNSSGHEGCVRRRNLTTTQLSVLIEEQNTLQ